ncbi:MAG: hypothetical protein Fur0018_01980 [Anaerolineales bacterium]
MKRDTSWRLVSGGFVVGIALGILLLVLFSGKGAPTQVDLTQKGRASPYVGAPAPDFSLPSLKGETISLSGFRGRPVVVNFWASWCGPCRLEMPDIQAQAEKWGDALVILGVNAGEPRGDAQAFVDELGLTFPILLDADNQAQRAYLVQGLPTTIVVDAQGIVQARHIGYMSGEQLDAYLVLVGLTP